MGLPKGLGLGPIRKQRQIQNGIGKTVSSPEELIGTLLKTGSSESDSSTSKHELHGFAALPIGVEMTTGVFESHLLLLP